MELQQEIDSTGEDTFSELVNQAEHLLAAFQRIRFTLNFQDQDTGEFENEIHIDLNYEILFNNENARLKESYAGYLNLLISRANELIARYNTLDNVDQSYYTELFNSLKDEVDQLNTQIEQWLTYLHENQLAKQSRFGAIIGSIFRRNS